MDIWNDLTDSFNKDMAIQEMTKKYLNTYLIHVSPQGKENVVQYLGYESGVHHLSDKHGMRLKFKHETNEMLVCKFPERCMFNFKGVALEFTRRPNRQFRRGICKDNCCIINPIHNLFGLSNFVLDHAVIAAALQPEYPETCEQALSLLDKKQVGSIALNNVFSISHSFTHKKNVYYVFFYTKVIGYIEKGIFHVKHPQFKQEVLDNLILFKPLEVRFA